MTGLEDAMYEVYAKRITAAIRQEIANLATLDNAIAWAATAERFVYCIDLLEISAHWSQADALVDLLESKLDQALIDAGMSSAGEDAT